MINYTAIIQTMPFFTRTIFFTNLLDMNLTKQNVAKSACLPFTLKDYKFTSVIGKGGFAEVYLVESIKFGTNFVAKVMTVDESEIQKTWEIFDAETTALSTLNHPHIIRLYDHFQIGTQFYYILEYCPNGSLYNEVQEKMGLSYPRFITVATQIVSALLYCHDHGIAHRDIKPGNILLDEYKRAKLSDFGLCLQTSAGQLHKAFSGSNEFTATEIFLKKPNDPMKGDVWALGVTFAILISGQSPWKSDSLGGMRQLAQKGFFRLPKSVPQDIREIISQMIVVDPDQRITMQQLYQNPLFHQTEQSIQRPFIKKSMSGNIKWAPIKRTIQACATYGEFPEFEDESPICVQSQLRCVSSTFQHNLPNNSRVKSRLSKAVSVTFSESFEDVKFLS